MKSPFLHLILSLIAGVAIFVGYGVWYAAITEKSTAVATLQQQIDIKTKNINRMSSAQSFLAEMAGDEAAIQDYFVPETGVVAFINDLEGRGRLLGATVSVLSVSADSASAQPALTFALSIKGTFDAVMRAVGAIEYAPYAISISTLSIEQDNKNSWHADLKLLVGSSAAHVATNTL